MALPERVQRVLAGRPVTIDGQTLATDVQLMLRLQRLARQPGAETLPIARGPAGAAPPHAAHRRRPADRERARPARRGPAGPPLRPDRGARRPARCWCTSTAAGSCTATSTATTPRCRFLAEHVRRPGAGGRLPARPRAPVPRGVRRRAGGVRLDGRARRRAGHDAGRASASVATRRAATSPPASRSRPRGRAGRAGCSCSSTRRPTAAGGPASAELFATGFYLTTGLHGPGQRQLRGRPTPTSTTRGYSPAARRPARRAWPRRWCSPRASTRCATRARRTRERLADGGVAGRDDPVPGPDPRLRQHRRCRALLARREPADRRGAAGRAAPTMAEVTVADYPGPPWRARTCTGAPAGLGLGGGPRDLAVAVPVRRRLGVRHPPRRRPTPVPVDAASRAATRPRRASEPPPSRRPQRSRAEPRAERPRRGPCSSATPTSSAAATPPRTTRWPGSPATGWAGCRRSTAAAAPASCRRTTSTTCGNYLDQIAAGAFDVGPRRWVVIEGGNNDVGVPVDRRPAQRPQGGPDRPAHASRTPGSCSSARSTPTPTTPT